MKCLEVEKSPVNYICDLIGKAFEIFLIQAIIVTTYLLTADSL